MSKKHTAFKNNNNNKLRKKTELTKGYHKIQWRLIESAVHNNKQMIGRQREGRKFPIIQNE